MVARSQTVPARHAYGPDGPDGSLPVRENVSDSEPIAVYSDYACPVCYLGREALAQYQSTREVPLRIDWHPFGLRSHKRNPDGSIDHSIVDGKHNEYFGQAGEHVRLLQERYGVEMEPDLSLETRPTRRWSRSSYTSTTGTRRG